MAASNTGMKGEIQDLLAFKKRRKLLKRTDKLIKKDPEITLIRSIVTEILSPDDTSKLLSQYFPKAFDLL